jgi:tetratricopeptide (TPR) repeat protein
MSLLMDALKKAELAKRQGQSEAADGSTETAAPGGLALEPISDSGFTDSAATPNPEAEAADEANLPPLASHLEELDARFLAEAQQAAAARLKAPPPPPTLAPVIPPAAAEAVPRAAPQPEPRRAAPEKSASADKSAAKNLFAAKQTEKPPARKSFAIAVGVVTVLSVSGIGGYFWWQLQPKAPLTVNRAPSPPPPAAVAAPAAVPPAPTLAAPPAAATSVAPLANSPGPARPPKQMAQDDEDDSPTVAVRPSITPKAAPQARRAAPAASAEPDSPIRVTKAPLGVNPALLRGYDAFNRGELALAQVEYERAQKSDPRNTDALHGLAAIAVRQGRLDQAELLYRRITEADPQDTVALAALINSRGQIDPGAAESRLKSLAAAQPELAAPHFSLGNLYARHGRWSDAQQAYFRAYSAEPDNPDILYNLAISLEHLRQNKLAAQYYGQAIAAAQNRPAGFDKAQASARLRTLQP